MRERPILFSGPMVRAILEGRKTQTRRIVKPQPELHGGLWVMPEPYGAGWSDNITSVPAMPGHSLSERNPYGRRGDRLWVRETWALVPASAYRASVGVAQRVNPEVPYDAALYREGFDRASGGIRWRPSIHMPRWASRLTLTITDVRVERLQGISTRDCWAEGIPSSPDVDPVHEFQELWRGINGADSWDANPWVWAITFTAPTGATGGAGHG